jgi:uncharacterized DUF497 family protein
MRYEWNHEKNLRLIEERGVSFEQVIEAIGSGRLLADQPHHQNIIQSLLRKYAAGEIRLEI